MGEEDGKGRSGETSPGAGDGNDGPEMMKMRSRDDGHGMVIG